MHRSFAVGLLWVSITGCVPLDADRPDESGLFHTGADDRVPTATLPHDLVRALGEGPVTVLVRLDDGLPTDDDTPPDPIARRMRVEDRARSWHDVQDTFVRALPAGITVRRTYTHVPVIALTVDDLEAAEALAADPGVWAIEPDTAHTVSLAESLGVIGQPAAELAGHTGAGTSVAVLDTGANWTAADLGSCTAVNTGANCRVVYAQDFAPSDGVMDDNGHGTNVSSIVAAVAPDTGIIALDVFLGASAWSTDIIAAIDWVVANQATYDIASINMSLGSGKYTTPCVSSFQAAIQRANAAGVSVVVASGNSAYSDGISSPACVDEAMSVGAVYDGNLGGRAWSGCTDTTTAADKITCFSNSASFLDILAPGALITAGGYTMGGTSQASPHVAGAIAVLRGSDPNATVDALEAQLVQSGVGVLDSRNGFTFPRLDLEEAAGGPVAVPDGTIVIDGGASGTRLTTVTLTLSSTTAATMCVSNTSSCTTYQAYTTSLPWTLGSGAGEKTVSVWFRNASNLTGPMRSDTIVLDTTVPTNGTVAAAGGNTSATLTFSGFADAGSGVASYVVVQATGTTAPTTCTGTPAWTGTTTVATITGLTNGTTYAWRVCAIDGATNLSTGATTSATPRVEYTPPTGTVSVNAGAPFTNDRLVTATLSASDTSGVTSVCLSNTPTCTAFVPMASSVSWTLATGSGEKTVWASFQDPHGNVSVAVSDTITVDTTLPANGTVTATGSDAAADLTWSGFTDATAGVASYVVVQATGTTAPANCTTSPVWSGTDGSAHIGSLVNGTTYSFRVCARDAAGNLSTGAVTSIRPAPENVAPVGTVSINAGADWTNSAATTVTLSATDTSGVASACVSNTTTCTTWFTMTASKTWTLSSGVGTKTVYGRFKDIHGNESVLVNDTIGLDTTAPVNGTVTATGIDGAVTLAFSGFTDASSGLASYGVHQATGLTAPANCTGIPVWTGSDSGTTISGLTNGTSYSFRVCATDLAGNRSSGVTRTVTPAPEFVAPTGTISINAGAAFTNLAATTVTLSATDTSGVASACLSNTTSCTTWFTMTPSKTWTLASGTGLKTVNGWFKDPYGNVSALVTDTITVDTTLPVNGTVTAAGRDGAVDLTWTGFSDASSGLASYKIVQATGTTAPTNCIGAAVATPSSSPVALAGLVNGTSYAWRVCAVDNAGNLSSGATATVRVASEYVAPTGTVVLNAGAVATNVAAVTATLAATDTSSVTEACLSNTTSCTAWFPMTTSKAWTLGSGSGLKTVSVWFKDPNGNVSTVVSDTITIETTKPVDGTLTATTDDAEMNLSWTAATDASGIASYKVVIDAALPAVSCTTGTVGYTGTATSASLGGLTNGATYSVRVCAIDGAGNVSTGPTSTMRIAAELVAPTGTITLNSGAAWTNDRTLAVTLAATDTSGVADLCLSATTTCTAWATYSTSTTFLVSSTAGTKTVNAWFRDIYGNVSALVSDTIGYEITGPSGGSVVATPDDGAIALSWSGFTDTSSGVASYKVVYAPTTAPTNCASGTLAMAGTATTTTISGLVNGTRYGVRVCGVDAAGNVGTGVTTTSTPAL